MKTIKLFTSSFILLVILIASKCEPTKKQIEEAKARYPLSCNCDGRKINGNSWRIQGNLELSKYGILSGTLNQSSNRYSGFSGQFSIQFLDSTNQHFYTYTSGHYGVSGKSNRQINVDIQNIPEYVLYNTFSLTCTQYKASSNKTGQYYADQLEPLVDVALKIKKIWAKTPNESVN